MKIQIPSINIIAEYTGGVAVFPEVWVTLDAWIKQNRIIPQTPSIIDANSLFENGSTQFVVTKESLLDVHQADGIVFENPLVWEADLAIFDIPMPETIQPSRIPTGGIDAFDNILKYTSTGTDIKKVGEWFDSLCEVWKNEVLGKVQIFTNPINNRFIEFHLVRAFALEFTVANHGSLTEDVEFITTNVAENRRDSDSVNWIKQQP